MLLKHGNFDQVEIELTKISTQTAISDEEGGWENEVSLAHEGWTEQPTCNRMRSISSVIGSLDVC